MEENQKRIDDSMNLLRSHAKEHGLDDFCFTEKDACRLIAMIDAGCELEEAAHILLISIHGCQEEIID